MKRVSFRKAQKGASLIEYGIIIGLVSAFSVGAVLGFGGETGAAFEVFSSKIASARKGEAVAGPGGGGSPEPVFFELVFNASNSQVSLPLYGAVNATIDWGGTTTGCPTTVSSVGTVDCTYAAPGTYTVKVSGLVDHYGMPSPGSAPNAGNLVAINSWGDVGLTSLESAFFGADNLLSLPAALPSTVTNIAFAFAGSAANPDISGWNVSNITTVHYAFFDAVNFNSDISGWTLTPGATVEAMFMGAAAFNRSLDGWDMSNVLKTVDMFSGATSFNQSLASWNVASVNDMSRMFEGATAFNGDISSWNTSSVGTFEWMFKNTPFNQDISGWNTSSAINMEAMFFGNGSFNQNISGWNTSLVENMNFMFYGDGSFDQDLSGWCVTNIPSEPGGFAVGTPIEGNMAKLPAWGTCP